MSEPSKNPAAETIAASMCALSVQGCLRTLFEKLGAEHRAHAVALAIRHRGID